MEIVTILLKEGQIPPPNFLFNDCLSFMEPYKDHLWVCFCGERTFQELVSHPS